MNSNISDLMRAALDYAAGGWPVFVLGRTKRPLANCPDCRTEGESHDREACPCLTCHGFYAATTNPNRVTAMLTTHPTGTLAIRTGAVSGLVVVDIDPGHGGTIDRELMPRTACVATGSGGWHLYYRHPSTPILNSQGQIGPGVDVRGDGGYVVAPPSIHPATRRPYRWIGGSMREMPPALTDACRPTPAAAAPAPTGPIHTTSAGGISSPAALLAAHLNAIAHAPKGRRRTTLYGAARGVARMVAAGAITTTDAWTALTTAGRAAGQTDREIRAAIAGGFTAEGVPA